MIPMINRWMDTYPRRHNNETTIEVNGHCKNGDTQSLSQKQAENCNLGVCHEKLKMEIKSEVI